MKSDKHFPIFLPLLAVVAAAIATFIFWPKSESIPDRPFTAVEVPTSTPDANFRVSLAGDRIATAADQFPITMGFVEKVTLNENVIEFRGWVPMDVRSPGGRIIIRDPFGLFEPVGVATVTSRERPDVAKGNPDNPALLHSGFSLATPLVDAPTDREWLSSLEVYAIDDDGVLFRLSRINQIHEAGWSKQPDTFEPTLVYSNPPYSTTEQKFGHLDAIVPIDEQGLVQLQGWAGADMRSPESRLVIRLPAAIAPASIVEYTAVERPDVADAYKDNPTNLRYSGFHIVLATRHRQNALNVEGAVAIWSIDPVNGPIAVHKPGK